MSGCLSDHWMAFPLVSYYTALAKDSVTTISFRSSPREIPSSTACSTITTFTVDGPLSVHVWNGYAARGRATHQWEANSSFVGLTFYKIFCRNFFSRLHAKDFPRNTSFSSPWRSEVWEHAIGDYDRMKAQHCSIRRCFLFAFFPLRSEDFRVHLRTNDHHARAC